MLNINKQETKKFYCPTKKRQQVLKYDLMRLMFNTAGLDEKLPLTVFKIQARDADTESVVTVTCYKTGNVMCMGHGNIFDLTTRLVALYHKPAKEKNLPQGKTDLPGRYLKREKKR